jgi:hypothetical protein
MALTLLCRRELADDQRMKARSVAGRIARLEQYRQPRSSYVLHLGTPPKPEELTAMEEAKSEGRRFAILPWVCASVEEWMATYARPEALQ